MTKDLSKINGIKILTVANIRWIYAIRFFQMELENTYFEDIILIISSRNILLNYERV